MNEAIKSIVKQPAFVEVEAFLMDIPPYEPDLKDPDAIIARNTLMYCEMRKLWKDKFAKLRAMAADEPENKKRFI